MTTKPANDTMTTATSEPAEASDSGPTQEAMLLTPPSSPRPEQFGSLTSPISPAKSLASPEPEHAATTSPKPKRRRAIPFLFRLLRKKNRNKKVAQAAAAGLEPPVLDNTTPSPNELAQSTPVPANEDETGDLCDVLAEPDPQGEASIDWLENKKEKKPKSGIFKLYRGKKAEAEKNDATSSPPEGNWVKKEEAVPRTSATTTKPPDNTPRDVLQEQGLSNTKGEKIDNVLVEETFVDVDEVAPTRALNPTTADDPEAAHQRKNIMKDSWEFYRLICGLVSDRDRYYSAFAKMQKDPVYPYLNSLTSVNDPGYVETENFDKSVVQREEESYAQLTKLEIAKALEAKARETLPEFLEICKSIAGALGVEELGIGPVKEAAWAMRKAQRKYDGDLLKVTDYCRVLIIVDDLAALLGLLELVRDSYGDLIRRVKLSTLKHDQKPKVGGYRDCTINMDVNGHICELQVHLRPLWNICQAEGYKHYVRCMEYKTDSFKDAYASLKGLDRKSLRELIALGEDLTAPFPLDELKPDQEKVIMDYFALAGLYYKVGSYSFGEIYFSRLFELRRKSFGPLHPQATFLSRYLVSCLNKQGKKAEANELEQAFALEKLQAQKEVNESTDAVSGTEISSEKEPATDEHELSADRDLSVDLSTSFWDGLTESFQQGTNSAYDLIMDPNRKVREQEESARTKIKESKQVWRAIRRERYPFLESAKDEEQEEETAEPPDVATENSTSENTKDCPEDASMQQPADSLGEAPPKNISEDTGEGSPKDTALSGLPPVTVSATECEHLEEKKDDAEPPSGEQKADGGMSGTEGDEEEAPSALDRLMENACSLCVTRTTSS